MRVSAETSTPLVSPATCGVICTAEIGEPLSELLDPVNGEAGVAGARVLVGVRLPAVGATGVGTFAAGAGAGLPYGGQGVRGDPAAPGCSRLANASASVAVAFVLVVASRTGSMPPANGSSRTTLVTVPTVIVSVPDREWWIGRWHGRSGYRPAGTTVAHCAVHRMVRATRAAGIDHSTVGGAKSPSLSAASKSPDSRRRRAVVRMSVHRSSIKPASVHTSSPRGQLSITSIRRWMPSYNE